MYATTPKKIIPHYSLQQTSGNGNNLFEIKEIGSGFRHSTHLYIPHRKDYYFFFLVKTGRNHHWIDFVNYEVRPDHLYFTLPHQVHLKEQHVPVEGTLLAFSEEFLLTEGDPGWRQLPILQNPDDRHELALSQQDREFLNQLFASMLTEYGQQQDWKKGMLQSWLKIVLVYLSRLYTAQFPVTPFPSESLSLVRRFKELVDEKYNSLHQVSDYAQLLNVTPGHLNDLVRQQIGITATNLIHQRVVLEAKRALFHADLSVKEIGYTMGFEDSAYFNRFFKRLTGETPVAFRNAIREKYH